MWEKKKNSRLYTLHLTQLKAVYLVQKILTPH